MKDENSLKIEYQKIGKFNCQYAYFDKTKINKVILWPGQMSFENVVKNLSKKTSIKDYIILAFEVNNWDNDLSPWESKRIKGKYFNGDGIKTLNFITNDFFPFFENKFPEIKNKPKIVGGYSLSGLFSLYCFYSTDIFNAVGGMSPSLWFEDWFKFMNDHHANNKDSYIYLSLGDLEEKSTTKPLDIGINVKKMYDIVKKDSNVKDCIYELNKGGHFKDGEERTSKGFAWLLERM